MRRYTFQIVFLTIISLLSVYFFIEQINLKKQIADINGQLTKKEIELKKLKITNKFGDTLIELSENDNYSGSVTLYNKSKNQTIRLNGGNKDENPGILMFKGVEKISFALMVQDKQNLLNIYNKNGLDVVSLGTDDEGHGGYSIKNAHGKGIKTEGWGWRAYKY